MKAIFWGRGLSSIRVCIVLLIIFDVDVLCCMYLSQHLFELIVIVWHSHVVPLPAVWGKHLTGPRIQPHRGRRGCATCIFTSTATET